MYLMNTLGIKIKDVKKWNIIFKYKIKNIQVWEIIFLEETKKNINKFSELKHLSS